MPLPTAACLAGVACSVLSLCLPSLQVSWRTAGSRGTDKQIIETLNFRVCVLLPFLVLAQLFVTLILLCVVACVQLQKASERISAMESWYLSFARVLSFDLRKAP